MPACPQEQFFAPGMAASPGIEQPLLLLLLLLEKGLPLLLLPKSQGFICSYGPPTLFFWLLSCLVRVRKGHFRSWNFLWLVLPGP